MQSNKSLLTQRMAAAGSFLSDQPQNKETASRKTTAAA
jgi:hypothetical protein